MSAFIVSKKTIDYIVSAYVKFADVFTVGSDFDPDKIGQMLWDENHKSVNYRYGEKSKAPKYKFSKIADVDPVVAIKQVHCLDYQSCEHDGWEKSQAFKFGHRLISILASSLPGYEAAPWGM
jgi:hypothetical protein